MLEHSLSVRHAKNAGGTIFPRYSRTCFVVSIHFYMKAEGKATADSECLRNNHDLSNYKVGVTGIGHQFLILVTPEV